MRLPGNHIKVINLPCLCLETCPVCCGLFFFFSKNYANCIVIADVSVEQISADNSADNTVEQAVRRTN